MCRGHGDSRGANKIITAKCFRNHSQSHVCNMGLAAIKRVLCVRIVRTIKKNNLIDTIINELAQRATNGYIQPELRLERVQSERASELTKQAGRPPFGLLIEYKYQRLPANEVIAPWRRSTGPFDRMNPFFLYTHSSLQLWRCCCTLLVFIGR